MVTVSTSPLLTNKHIIYQQYNIYTLITINTINHLSDFCCNPLLRGFLTIKLVDILKIGKHGE